MAERLTEDLWRLEIPLVGNPLKTLNSYLFQGAERSLLIDTGFRQDPCREAMNRQLDALGVDRDRMDIFLTHLHSDHTGLAPELIRPGCRLYISEIDGRGVEEGLHEAYWERIYRGYVEEGFTWGEIDRLRGGNPAREAAPRSWKEQIVCLEDGDALDYGSCVFRCVLTPGHTPGHLCLYAPQRGWFFSGDHVLFHITPNICRWEQMPDALGSYLESLDKIRDLPASLLLPGHRIERGGLAERVDQLKTHHAQRLDDTMSIVRKTPGLTACEIAGKMAWSIRCRDWADFPTTQKFFAVGETLAHLDYWTVRRRLRRRADGAQYRYYPMDAANPIL